MVSRPLKPCKFIYIYMRASASSLWYKMCTFLTNMAAHILTNKKKNRRFVNTGSV
jgi:hypothetical protein